MKASRTRRIARRAIFHSHTVRAVAPTASTATTTTATIGYFTARMINPATDTSSKTDTATLETGSGDVLITSLVLALAAWASRASAAATAAPIAAPIDGE